MGNRKAEVELLPVALALIYFSGFVLSFIQTFELLDTLLLMVLLSVNCGVMGLLLGSFQAGNKIQFIAIMLSNSWFIFWSYFEDSFLVGFWLLNGLLMVIYGLNMCFPRKS